MTVTVIGNYPKVERVVSGFWSLDHALSNEYRNEIGLPLASWEVYGASGVGKSTFCSSVAGMYGREREVDIAYAPMEHIDVDLIVSILDHQGFSGTLRICDGESAKRKKKEALSDELILEELQDSLEKDYGIAILDSVGAISPIAEVEGDLGGANMGRRALLVTQYIRRVTRIRRVLGREVITFAINHQHEPIGNKFAHKKTTTGGVTLDYLSRVRIELKTAAFDKNGGKEFCKLPDGSYAVLGTVNKLSFGRSGRKFQVFNLSGYGLDVNMTAVLDCVCSKLATVKDKKVYLGGEDMGKIVDLVENAKINDIRLKENIFQPFKDALNGAGNVESLESEDEEGEE